MVELRLQHGADYRRRDSGGTTPLDSAIYAGHEKIATCILDTMESSGCTKEEIIGSSMVKNTILHVATPKGYEDILKILAMRLGTDQLEFENCFGVTLLFERWPNSSPLKRVTT
ncbi:hypothetical protein IFR05_012390 [Cadophora sp. M221]|nr:hypothetical protein IFR05_012390 [Cadophora sp. M221]